ncbi:unnamed protein product [Lasius platythorax]|uniref:Uncharacterized protein n=1 Tax=Lasius platythorax TaxID=488582 RepID=A0AAV2NXL6_9HYME
MGLKWFRARLSIKKEASKVPAMTGLYRRVSHSESNVAAMPKNEDTSPSISSDTTAIANNEGAQYDRSKADFANQLSSSSIIDSEEHGDYAIINTEPSTSKDSNLKEQSLSRDEESNKINTEQSDSSDTKSRICSDNELVI